MNVLIVGATGATGRLLTEQLLKAGHTVKAVSRSKEKLEYLEKKYPNLFQIPGTVLGMGDDEVANYITNCEAVVSCLGHNLTFKGIYGNPRRLVRDTLVKLTKAIEIVKPDKRIKLVLMNTTGNPNKDLSEKYPFQERVILHILYWMLPPHTDNIQAAEYLRTQIGQDHPYMEWVSVRPDTLIDEVEVTDFEFHPSPTGGVIFGSKNSSRINIANAMMRLILEGELWEKWKGKMPVIYNK